MSDYAEFVRSQEVLRMNRMNRTASVFTLVLCLFTAISFWQMRTAESHENESGKKSIDAKLDLDQTRFMRKKLEASSQILEGLVTEDSGLIIKGAKVLAEMSSAEKWQVQHNVTYKQLSSEFLQSVTKLREAAENENFDGVALKWIDTTMKCMECHSHVRGARVAIR